MVSEKLLTYLTEWLCSNMEAQFKSWKKSDKAAKSLRFYGVKDHRRQLGKEGVLLTLIRDNVCYTDKKHFLASSEGQIFHAYNGKYFEQIDGRPDKFIKELVRRVFRKLEIGTIYHTYTADMITRECTEILSSSDEFQYVPNKRYIAFQNGIFDIVSGKLKDFDLKYRPFIALDIDYTPSKELYTLYDKEYGVKREVNPAKLWEWKISEIIPNKDMRDAFQMFCGSLLLDRSECKFEYVAYLIGPGSNGKSVLADTIASVFGEKYFSRFTPRQLFKDSDARVNIAALEGKIANLVGDLETKDIEGGGDFKRFASGEKFQGRRNYKDPIQVTAPPLLCCTNSMPETNDDSWGFHRRQLPIYTTRHRFTEEDKDPYLTQKLTTEDARRWVFLWIYDGYRMIMRNKGNIILGDDVLRAIEELQSDSNSGRRWFRDMDYSAVGNPVSKDPRWKPLKDLYNEYVEYAIDCGYSNKLKSHEISRLLQDKGCAKKRLSGGIYFCLEQNKQDNIQSSKEQSDEN